MTWLLDVPADWMAILVFGMGVVWFGWMLWEELNTPK